MTVSFKARIEGLNSNVLKTIFESKTKSDNKHTVFFVKGHDHYGDDRFELYKDGYKTAEYEAEVVHENFISIQRLIGIFNILKAKEAQSRVLEMKMNHKK